MWPPVSVRDGDETGELRRLAEDISEKVLIQQQQDLEETGLVHRQHYNAVPPTVEYSLTAFGESLNSVLTPSCGWGEAHMDRIIAGNDCHAGEASSGLPHALNASCTDDDPGGSEAARFWRRATWEEGNNLGNASRTNIGRTSVASRRRNTSDSRRVARRLMGVMSAADGTSAPGIVCRTSRRSVRSIGDGFGRQAN